MLQTGKLLFFEVVSTNRPMGHKATFTFIDSSINCCSVMLANVPTDFILTFHNYCLFESSPQFTFVI